MSAMHQVGQCVHTVTLSSKVNRGQPGKSQNEGTIVEQRETPSTASDLLLASVQVHEITLVIMTAAMDPTASAVLGNSQILQQN